MLEKARIVPRPSESGWIPDPNVRASIDFPPIHSSIHSIPVIPFLQFILWRPSCSLLGLDSHLNWLPFIFLKEGRIVKQEAKGGQRKERRVLGSH